MAEKTERKPEASREASAKDKPDAGKPASGAAKASGGLLSKTPLLLGGVMIVEAAVLFAGFKFLGGGPKGAHGAELAITESSEPESAPAPAEHGSSSHEASSAEPAKTPV